MLQQRFLITLFFSLAIFLIKFLLFFVQFSVHVLFFTCFFLLQKNTASFPFFIVSHPLSRIVELVFFFFSMKTSSSERRPGIPDSIKAQTSENVAAAAGVQNRSSTPNTGRWGFVGCVCLCVCFCMDCDFFLFCLSVCCFFYISIHI